MKLSAGVVFMVVILFVGLAALSGGEVWVRSGSVAMAAVAGLAVLGILIVLFRLFLRRAGAELRVRFLGEAASGLDESEFTEVAEGAEAARLEIERGVQHRPDRVADSIRSLLVQDKSRESK